MNRRISVIVASYNQERYIRECLDGIAMQRGDFELEVILGDNGSVDGTAEIMREYARRYPDAMRMFRSSENLGLAGNLKRCLDACTGEFIAVCEGDDYWTSPRKLRTQMEFLDTHPECSMCFNRLVVKKFDQYDVMPVHSRLANGATFSADDIIDCHYSGNFSCCMYRASVVRKLPPGIFNLPMADWMFNICCAEQGRIGFVKELMSVYRMEGQGIWSSLSFHEQALDTCRLIPTYDAFLEGRHHHAFERKFHMTLDSLNTPEDRDEALTILNRRLDEEITSSPAVQTHGGESVGSTLPRVSVVMASYNHEKFVAECIRSVLDQGFQDFEFVITDDGSSDRTVDVIRSFRDPRIRLFEHQVNLGACQAGNNGVIHARGKYIAILNSDDAWEPDKLEKQVDFLERNPGIGVVFSKARMINEKSEPLDDDRYHYASVFEAANRGRHEWLNYFFFVGNCLCHPGALIRKEVYEKVGLYNETMASLPDFEFWIRVCRHFEIHVQDERLVRFRILDNEANASGHRPDNVIRGQFEYFACLERFLDIDSTDELIRIFPRLKPIEDRLCRELIPYYIAWSAFQRTERFSHAFALTVLRELLDDPEKALLLARVEHFTTKNLIELAGRYDIFQTCGRPTPAPMPYPASACDDLFKTS